LHLKEDHGQTEFPGGRRIAHVDWAMPLFPPKPCDPVPSQICGYRFVDKQQKLLYI
jgi:hypothetical protein